MGDSHLPPEYLALATAEKKKKTILGKKKKKDTAQNEPVFWSSLPSPACHIHMLLTNWAAVFTPT